MKSTFGSAMSAATALTRQGRLSEATALIQRAFATAGLQQPPRPVPPSSAPSTAPAALVREVHPERPATRAGEFSYRSLVRGYDLFVPPTSSAPPGLVVMLHGCTQDPADFARGTRTNEAAVTDGCIVLYPAQARAANANGCWNWFEPHHQKRDQGEAGLIAHLTRHVIDEFEVDAARVAIAGLSAGGAMAAIVADAYPELYAAVCIHSGLPVAAASSLSEALLAMRSGSGRGRRVRVAGRVDGFVPTIVFHGTSDHTVHVSNADAIVSAALDRARQPTSTVEVVELRDAKKRRVTKTTHVGVDRQVLVEDWRVQSGVHAWFGGSATGSHTDAHGIDATTEMMRFFAEHGRKA